MPSLARCTLTWALTVALFAAAPGLARAQTRTTGSDVTTRAALVSERQHVRAELEHVNAEIDALKRADRSVRDDYRLRARLADAEALARRLTALDARLGTGPTIAPAPTPGVEPRVAPGDGPVEFAAKADILTDQARRLGARAEALHLRAQDLKARQNLRRRVGQMERDPFSPLEGSRRRATVSAGAGSAAKEAATPVSGNGTNGPPLGANDSSPAVGQAAPSLQPGGAAVAPPPTGVQTPAPGGSTALVSGKAGPTPTGGTLGASEGVALSVQLRDLLDPATLAEIRRMETSGAAGGGIEALERAAMALQLRADHLRQQAAALRASEHPAPRPR
jgi:hypothetical protein